MTGLYPIVRRHRKPVDRLEVPGTDRPTPTPTPKPAPAPAPVVIVEDAGAATEPPGSNQAPLEGMPQLKFVNRGDHCTLESSGIKPVIAPNLASGGFVGGEPVTGLQTCCDTLLSPQSVAALTNPVVQDPPKAPKPPKAPRAPRAARPSRKRSDQKSL